MTNPELLTPSKKPFNKVKIDWSNPITESLTGCFLFQSRFPLENLVPGMPDILVASGPAPVVDGNDISIEDTENYNLELGNEVIGGTTTVGAADVTFFFVVDFQQPAVGNNDNYLISNSNAAGQDVYLYLDNTGTDGRLSSFDGVKFQITSQEPDVTSGTYDTCASTNISATNSYTLYLNGGSIVGGSQLNFTQLHNSLLDNDSIHIFNDGNNPTRRYPANFRYFYIFNRTLSDAEIAALHLNQTMFLIPAT